MSHVHTNMIKTYETELTAGEIKSLISLISDGIDRNFDDNCSSTIVYVCVMNTAYHHLR